MEGENQLATYALGEAKRWKREGDIDHNDDTHTKTSNILCKFGNGSSVWNELSFVLTVNWQSCIPGVMNGYYILYSIK